MSILDSIFILGLIKNCLVSIGIVHTVSIYLILNNLSFDSNAQPVLFCFQSGTHPSEGSSNPSSPSSTQNNAFFNYQAAVNNNAPKYGTVVPKRVFVGGITSTTTEDELCELFSQYGIVKQVKIVVDRGGISKGYGFITFDSEEEAKRLQKDVSSGTRVLMSLMSSDPDHSLLSSVLKSTTAKCIHTLSYFGMQDVPGLIPGGQNIFGSLNFVLLITISMTSVNE